MSQNFSAASLQIRIYYEDTDAGGVVYYANYLRYFERARTEWLRSLGFEQDALMRDRDIVFVARSAQIEYLKPARLDDMIDLRSTIESVGRAQVMFAQRAERNGELLVDAKIRIACFGTMRGKAVAMPKEIYGQFKSIIGASA